MTKLSGPSVIAVDAGVSSAVTHFVHQQTLRLDKLLRSPELTRGRVHHIRSCSLRLSAAVWAISRVNRSGDSRKYKRLLKKLRRRLSLLRTLDVAIQDAKEFSLPVVDLKKRRWAYLLKLKSETRPIKTSKVRRRAREFEQFQKQLLAPKPLNNRKALRSQSPTQAQQRLSPSLAPAAAQLRARALKFLSRKKWSSKELHDLRIFLKRVRYFLEMTEQNPGDLPAFLKILGRWHDLEELSRWIDISQAVDREKKRHLRVAQSRLKQNLRFVVRTLTPSLSPPH